MKVSVILIFVVAVAVLCAYESLGEGEGRSLVEDLPGSFFPMFTVG